MTSVQRRPGTLPWACIPGCENDHARQTHTNYECDAWHVVGEIDTVDPDSAVTVGIQYIRDVSLCFSDIVVTFPPGAGTALSFTAREAQVLAELMTEAKRRAAVFTATGSVVEGVFRQGDVPTDGFVSQNS